MKKDLTFGTDCRGDDALFIERKHFINEWELDLEVNKFFQQILSPTFFRVIYDGIESHSHGWIENGEIIQWG